MLDNILVAIDFSQQSESALERAIELALITGGKLTLLWAATEDSSAQNAAIYGSSVQTIERLLAEQHAENARRLNALADQARAAGVASEVRVQTGHADEVIVEVAEEIAATLIVVGTRGLTGVRRFFLGSVADKVVRTSTCHVLVARGGTGDGETAGKGLRRILVPTDFSNASEPALDIAVSLVKESRQAPESGATITLLHAWQFPPGTHGLNTADPKSGPFAEVRDEIIASNAAMGDKLIARHGDSGVTMRFVQEHGPAAAAIQEHLEALLQSAPYDLVVMGTHGYRGFRRFLLGSVAEATVRHAPCSVLVAHGPRD